MMHGLSRRPSNCSPTCVSGTRSTQLRSGEQPDDFLDPAQLGALTRSHLKEAFRAVASVQRRIGTELSLPGS